MDQKTVSLLIVEDDPDYIFFLKDLLSGEETAAIRYRKYFTNTLNQTVEALSQISFNMILLDLHLPDSQGFATMQRIISAAPCIPVVVLISLGEEALGVQAIHEGAQDYHVKAEISSAAMRKAINYTIERQSLFFKLEKASMGSLPKNVDIHENIFINLKTETCRNLVE